MSKIAELIKEIVGKTEKSPIACVVDVVYEDGTCDCTPIDDNIARFKRVRLNAVLEENKGIIIKPKQKSIVFITEITNTDSYVSLYSEIESIEIIIGNTLIKLDKSKVEITGGKVLRPDGSEDKSAPNIVLNGGSLGGLIKIDALVSKINTIEDKLDSLIGNYNKHTHDSASFSGSMTVSGVVNQITGTLSVPATLSTDSKIASKTERSDIENTKITHG